MRGKSIDVIVHVGTFLFIYGLFAWLYAGLALLEEDVTWRLIPVGFYGVYSVAIAIWLGISANKESDLEERRLRATISLAFVALFVSCVLAFLIPELLLKTSTLWFVFKACGGFFAFVLLAIGVLFIASAYKE